MFLGALFGIQCSVSVIIKKANVYRLLRADSPALILVYRTIIQIGTVDLERQLRGTARGRQ